MLKPNLAAQASGREARCLRCGRRRHGGYICASLCGERI